MTWLSQWDQPPLDVVGCSEHQELAATLARRAITLVRNDGLLPLRLGLDDRILAVMPQPTDLTPADTSSLVHPGLASAIRSRHPQTTELIIDQEPSDVEVAAVLEAASRHDLIVAGTIDAGPGQANLINALVATEKPVIVVALRTPYDLARFPSAPNYVCTYGIHPPSMEAASAALFEEGSFPGRLPAAVPGIYPVGHAWGAESR